MNEPLTSLPAEDAQKALSRVGFRDPATIIKTIKLLETGPFGPVLEEAIALAALSPSPDGAINNLETIGVEVPQGHIKDALRDPANLGRIITICGSSPFLSNILAREEGLFEWIFLKGGLYEIRDTASMRASLAALAEGVEDFDGMARVLRLHKKREFLRIGARDLLGVADVRETTRELSDLASASLDAALSFALERSKKAFGPPLYTDFDGNVKEAVMTVMGLGKLGGRELNFSSDIDIIYVYSSDKGETAGVEGRPETKISLHAFFIKTAMTLTKLISGVTGDGFVFRVDLDLRPEGRSGDMANSLRSMEIYYESWGASWERAAMIKARPVAGSTELGEEFLSMIRPFVFRRYLDFTALDEIKTMKEKIDLSRLRRNPDTIDVKLGAGGIREIEFFCQALQLIHAGKDQEIRERSTLAALEKLRRKGYINDAEFATLTEGYVFLRNLEHRIQIVEGRQTQMIPPKAEELERLARMMGFRDTEENKAGDYFWEEYRKKTAFIHEIYRSLFYKEEGEAVPDEVKVLFSPDMTEDEAGGRLAALGFKDTEAARKNLVLLKTGPPFIHLGARAQVLLQKLAPLFLQAAAGSPDPDRSLAHLERFLASIGARTTFYSLLAENPKVLSELVKLFGTSVFLSRDLIEHPESLDILLSNELAIPYRRKEEIAGIMAEAAAEADYEEKLDTLRRLKNEEVFRVGINDIADAITTRQVSIQLTFLAEACLEAAIRIAWDELRERYGDPAGSRFFVLGMGKLGGRELIYGSDLDIIFVYSGNGEDRTSGGPREITHHEFFVKLGQRIISVLTIRTKEGYVFNVDARLRPSGSAGPLVVSREALINYQRDKTQVWERQAFTKARAVAGDTVHGTEVLKELEEIVFSRPLTEADAGEIARIRGRMEAEIAKEDASRYNIKTGKGGIVDIEFIVQALQLRHGSVKGFRTPNTLKALERLSREGVLAPEEAVFLKEAHGFLRLLETRMRIVNDRPEGYLYRESEELTTLARRAGYAGADPGVELLSNYLDYSKRVRDIYMKTMKRLQGI